MSSSRHSTLVPPAKVAPSTFQMQCESGITLTEVISSNLTFGVGGKGNDGNTTAGWGYYETIAGGSGAGPGWHGTSGVHTHITNTRIGDVEILERRYPIMLHQFGIRPGSGGKGRWKGGDGVVREIEVLQPLQVSMLSEVSAPANVCTLSHSVRSVEENETTVWYGRRRTWRTGQEYVG
jgi:N-methylhydantoinase B/oxoprolinase/acetone carboxylase alpha subunit